MKYFLFLAAAVILFGALSSASNTLFSLSANEKKPNWNGIQKFRFMLLLLLLGENSSYLASYCDFIDSKSRSEIRFRALLVLSLLLLAVAVGRLLEQHEMNSVTIDALRIRIEGIEVLHNNAR